ncbi:MAG: hypothetical protein ACE5PM_06450 [Candidatus Hydrothermarchaeales archaeon]
MGTTNKAMQLLETKARKYGEVKEKDIVAKRSETFKKFVKYQDGLTEHWKPGAPTRDINMEEKEKEYFSEYLAKRFGDGVSKILLFDLGGGDGKVVDWFSNISSLMEDKPDHKIVYFYADVAPKMRELAKKKYLKYVAEHPDFQVSGLFTLMDVTNVYFTREEYRTLHKYFDLIIQVCAGGTIGNLGELEDIGYEAQKKVIDKYFKPSDFTFITFLDPEEIRTSMREYTDYGVETSAYDSLKVRFVLAQCAGHKIVAKHLLNFRNKKEYDEAFTEVADRACSLKGKPFFVVIEMWKDGEYVGQISRHYSKEYFKKNLFEKFKCQEFVKVGRAIITCATPLTR